ncbi:MAG: hypothetical protein J6J87_10745 [Oscillospiraceae bacterium]|nr:hypothetical protein [Oscillospiraceae bacterium]
MKRKAPLSMMELMVMIAVFALSATLCLQAFVKSDRVSRRVEARDRASVLCQSVAEVIRHNGGDLEAALNQVNGTEPKQRDGFWFENYDENWQVITYEESGREPLPISSGSRTYTIWVTELDGGLPGLGRANVEVFDCEGDGMESLFSIEVSWQKEVTGRG